MALSVSFVGSISWWRDFSSERKGKKRKKPPKGQEVAPAYQSYEPWQVRTNPPSVFFSLRRKGGSVTGWRTLTANVTVGLLQLQNALMHYKTKTVAAFIKNTGDDNLVMKEKFVIRAAEEAEKLIKVAATFKDNKVVM